MSKATSKDLGQFPYFKKSFLRILKKILIAVANVSPYGEAMSSNRPLRQKLTLRFFNGEAAEKVKSLTAPKQQYWQKTEETLKFFQGRKKNLHQT